MGHRMFPVSVDALACKPIVANLEKKLKGKFTRSEAKSDLENAFKALSILKTVKAQVFKALKD